MSAAAAAARRRQTRILMSSQVKIYGYRGCSRCRTTNLQEQWIEGRGRYRSGFVRIDRRAVSKKPINNNNNNNTTTTTTTTTERVYPLFGTVYYRS